MSFQSSGSRSNYLGALSQIKTCHFQLIQRFFVFTRAGSVPCRSFAVLCAILLLPRERGGSSASPGWVWPGRTEGQGAVPPRLCLQESWEKMLAEGQAAEVSKLLRCSTRSTRQSKTSWFMYVEMFLNKTYWGHGVFWWMGLQFAMFSNDTCLWLILDLLFLYAHLPLCYTLLSSGLHQPCQTRRGHLQTLLCKSGIILRFSHIWTLFPSSSNLQSFADTFVAGGLHRHPAPFHLHPNNRCLKDSE